VPDRPRDRSKAEPLTRLAPELSREVDAADVVAYLRRHPEFLAEHPEAMRLLRPPPRDAGAGVLDFQHFLLDRLRADLDRLSGENRSLLLTTRNNLASQARVHKAALAILTAASFEQLFQIVSVDLAVFLDVDVVTVAVESEIPTTSRPAPHGIRLLRAGTVEALLGPDKPALLEGEVSGDPALFGSAAGLVRSHALLRLGFGKANPTGLLCIGTRKPGRFHPGLGTELLGFLARALSITIAQWLKPR
jgi:uncharacterized protein YigA (DUF484 family)